MRKLTCLGIVALVLSFAILFFIAFHFLTDESVAQAGKSHINTKRLLKEAFAESPYLQSDWKSVNASQLKMLVLESCPNKCADYDILIVTNGNVKAHVDSEVGLVVLVGPLKGGRIDTVQPDKIESALFNNHYTGSGFFGLGGYWVSFLSPRREQTVRSIEQARRLAKESESTIRKHP